MCMILLASGAAGQRISLPRRPVASPQVPRGMGNRTCGSGIPARVNVPLVNRELLGSPCPGGDGGSEQTRIVRVCSLRLRAIRSARRRHSVPVGGCEFREQVQWLQSLARCRSSFSLIPEGVR